MLSLLPRQEDECDHFGVLSWQYIGTSLKEGARPRDQLKVHVAPVFNLYIYTYMHSGIYINIHKPLKLIPLGFLLLNLLS